MAEPAAVRNARAQRQLRDLGIDPGPLRGASNRLRKARGAARGLTPSQAVGKPRVGEALVSRPSEVRQARTRLQVRGAPKRDVSFGPSGRVVQSTDQRYIRQQLKEASRRGERVAVRITANDGRGTKTHAINGTADQQRKLRDRAAMVDTTTGGRGGKAPPDAEGVDIVAKPQLIFSSSPEVFDAGSGFDPDDLLDWLDTYDDFYDAWADLWDEEYQ